MSKWQTYLFSFFRGLLVILILTSVLVKTLDLQPTMWETQLVDFEDEPKTDVDGDDEVKWMTNQLQTTLPLFYVFFEVYTNTEFLRYWVTPVLEVPERPPLL